MNYLLRFVQIFIFVFSFNHHDSHAAAQTEAAQSLCETSLALASHPYFAFDAVRVAQSASNPQASSLKGRGVFETNQRYNGFYPVVLRVVSEDSQRQFYQLPLVWLPLAEIGRAHV